MESWQCTRVSGRRSHPSTLQQLWLWGQRGQPLHRADATDIGSLPGSDLTRSFIPLLSPSSARTLELAVPSAVPTLPPGAPGAMGRTGEGSAVGAPGWNAESVSRASTTPTSVTYAFHQALKRNSPQEPEAWRPWSSPGSGRPHTHLFKNVGLRGFPGGAVVKNPPANAGDTGLSPGPGRSYMQRSS